MPLPSIQFVFDFGSPNAFLCHRLMPALVERTGVQIEYLPILLGGLFKLSGNRSPAETFAGVPNKRAYERVDFGRFIRRHDLASYRPNPHFPLNTLHLMRGAVASQQLECFPDYVESIFTAAWEQDRDLSSDEVVLDCLQRSGLDAEAILSVAQSPVVKRRLIDNTQAVFERGAFGSPTFFVGPEMFFGKDRLQEVEDEILRQKSHLNQ